MRVGNLDNEYAPLFLGRGLDAPKEVAKAIAVSFAIRYASGADVPDGEVLHAATLAIAREWVVLHQNGIVPQPPPKAVRLLAAEFSEVFE